MTLRQQIGFSKECCSLWISLISIRLENNLIRLINTELFNGILLQHCSVVLRVLWFLLGFLLGWFLFGGCFSSIAYHIVFINIGIHLANFFPLHILSCFHYQVSLYTLGRMLWRSGAGRIKHQGVVPFQGSREILSMQICSTFHVLYRFTQASKNKHLTYFLLQKMFKHWVTWKEDNITYLHFHWE